MPFPCYVGSRKNPDTNWSITCSLRLRQGADAFAVAKALQSGAMVVTGDPEYKKVSKIVEILWVK